MGFEPRTSHLGEERPPRCPFYLCPLVIELWLLHPVFLNWTMEKSEKTEKWCWNVLYLFTWGLKSLVNQCALAILWSLVRSLKHNIYAFLLMQMKFMLPICYWIMKYENKEKRGLDRPWLKKIHAFVRRRKSQTFDLLNLAKKILN